MKSIIQVTGLLFICLVSSTTFAQKHLIFLDGYLPWTYTLPPYLVEHHEEIENLPFSGISVNGNVFTNYVMSDPSKHNVSYQRIWNEVGPLKNVFKKKTDNFLRINVDFPGDFWDDDIWNVTTQNFANVAKAAKNIGFKGIIFDDEAYTSDQHLKALMMSNFKFPKQSDVIAHRENYAPWEINESEQINRGDWIDYACKINGIEYEDSENCSYRNPAYTFKEHMEKVASRFKTIMEAMEAEYPDITLLVLHGAATSHPNTNVDGHYIKPNSIYQSHEYIGAMFVGFKQGLNGQASLHDMGEYYQYQSNQHYQNAYQWRKYDITSQAYNQNLDDDYQWVIPSGDRGSWAKDVNIGFMVTDYGLKQDDHPEYNTLNACHPMDAGRRMSKAIRQSDDYVIYYSDSSLSQCDKNNPVRWMDVSTPVRAEWLNTLQTAYDNIQTPAVLPAILSIILDDSSAIPSEPVVKPTFSDVSLPELTGAWHGAMGEHPVRKATMTSPWANYANNSELKVDMYFPADVAGKRPTVFFIPGWNIHDSGRYRGLLYFIASQGFNAVFVPYIGTDGIGHPEVLLNILDSVATGPWSSVINLDKVGFSGHSAGAGLVFYLAQQRPNWGTQGRFLFPLAAWWGYHLPAAETIQLPANTDMIVQVNKVDDGTDPRQNIDFFLHNNISLERKTFLYLPGDANHEANHGLYYANEANGIYHYDALQQVGIFRPLESLMRYSFKAEEGIEWKKIGLPDEGDDNYNVMYQLNGIKVLSTDTPLANHTFPIPVEADLDPRYLCSHAGNPRNTMCMPCKDTSRDAPWQQCQ